MKKMRTSESVSTERHSATNNSGSWLTMTEMMQCQSMKLLPSYRTQISAAINFSHEKKHERQNCELAAFILLEN